MLRAERSGDEGAIRTIHRRAFGGETESAIVDSVRSAPGFDRSLSIVAEFAGAAVGHVLFSAVEIVGEERKTDALALAPIAVMPAYQRRGIGTQLVRAGLDACRVRGHKLVVVLGHSAFYARFGFVEASTSAIYAPWSVPSKAFRVAELSPKALCGVHGIVRYPAFFHA